MLGARGVRPVAALGTVAVLLGVLVGTRVAIGILRQPEGRPATALADPGAGGLGLGHGVRTSFGSLVVTGAELNDGLSPADLGGMSHGVSQLVGTGSAQVSVVVTLTNSGRHDIDTAAGQFRLLTGRRGAPTGVPVGPQGTSLHAGRLAPGSAVEARVTFVTPADGSQLWLQYADPAGGRPIRIALGTATKGASPPEPGHH